MYNEHVAVGKQCFENMQKFDSEIPPFWIRPTYLLQWWAGFHPNHYKTKPAMIKKQSVFTSKLYMYLTKCIINTWSLTLSLSFSLSDLIVQFDSFVVVSPGLHLYSFLGDVLCSYSSTEDSQQHIILLNRLVQSVTKI